MIYRNLATAVAIACTASAYGYAPTSTNVVKPFAHGAVSDRAVVGECDSSRRRCAPAHLNAAGGTETVDFTAGTIRPQRDVVDGQMRPRPNIDWSNLRAKLELDFGIPEETLKKYDTIEKGDMLKASAAATRDTGTSGTKTPSADPFSIRRRPTTGANGLGTVRPCSRSYSA